MEITMSTRKAPVIGLLVVAFSACAAHETHFALKAPVSRDTDLRSVEVPCRQTADKEGQRHVSCAPEEYVSPLIWDGMDNLVFRLLSDMLAVSPGGEAVNVNSLDEVPDSAWFTNRLNIRPMPIEELTLGACDPSQLLDPQGAADGTWIIDKGKGNGSSPGFRVSIPGKGKYMLKSDADRPERPSAASVIGAAVYHAAGFYTSCEQIVYFRPSLLKLSPGLRYQGNFNAETDFDQTALDQVLANSPKRGPLVRMQASAWLPGRLIGPFRYEGTRHDDPNDAIPHDDRRELRGGRLLAAWIDHFDAREQNSMDTWIADAKRDPEASPGRVIHYYLDTSDCLGSEWEWDEISRRLGHSYVLDWGDMARDFLTLGIPLRPWDRARHVPGREIFGYFNVSNFDPDEWKNEYPNAAFSRMTELDGAWMARILARFTPEMIGALARMGQFSDPSNADYLAGVLQGRLAKILDRYLTRLSPIADVRLQGSDQLCGVDLAAQRKVAGVEHVHYGAQWSAGSGLVVSTDDGIRVCVALPHVAPDQGHPDDSPDRYVRVTIEDGIAKGPLVAHLYDLGPARGYRLAGLQRPEP
jgi:hypothetical protein